MVWECLGGGGRRWRGGESSSEPFPSKTTHTHARKALQRSKEGRGEKKRLTRRRRDAAGASPEFFELTGGAAGVATVKNTEKEKGRGRRGERGEEEEKEERRRGRGKRRTEGGWEGVYISSGEREGGEREERESDVKREGRQR